MTGICGVNIVALPKHRASLKTRFSGPYGKAKETDGSIVFTTANGVLDIPDPAAFSRMVGPLPDAVAGQDTPCICGMDFTMTDPKSLTDLLILSGTAYRDTPGGFALTDPGMTANTVFRF